MRLFLFYAMPCHKPYSVIARCKFFTCAACRGLYLSWPAEQRPEAALAGVPAAAVTPGS